MTSIFGGYDVRGKYGPDLNGSHARRLGRAFAFFSKNIAFGFDNRASSEELSREFLAGFIESGGKAINVGLVPTPVLYYSIVKLGVGGGVMVTASHLTAEYNGFKFLKGKMPLSTEQMIVLEKKFRENYFVSGKESASSSSGNESKAFVAADYVKHVCSLVKPARKLKVVVDSGNGVCGPLAKELYEKLGCKVVGLFLEPDARFPNHVPDPHKTETLKWLSESVVKEKADFGIALDADGDRCLFVDDLGRPVAGDFSNVLFARSLLGRGQASGKRGGVIASEVRSSMVLKEEVERAGGVFVETKAGRVAVRESMEEKKAVFGCEITGHVCFKENNGFDDGLFAGARMIELVAGGNKKLSLLVGEIPTYCSSPEYRVNVKDKLGIVNAVKKAFVKKGLKFSELDGVKLILPEAWGLVRVSNTEEKITLRFEGKTRSALEDVKALFSTELTKCGVQAL